MSRFPSILLFFFFNDTATTEIYTLSLHDALPILPRQPPRRVRRGLLHARHRLVQQGRERDAPRAPRHRAAARRVSQGQARSEEHTSELQSRPHLVCRLLLEQKKPS